MFNSSEQLSDGFGFVASFLAKLDEMLLQCTIAGMVLFAGGSPVTMIIATAAIT